MSWWCEQSSSPFFYCSITKWMMCLDDIVIYNSSSHLRCSPESALRWRSWSVSAWLGIQRTTTENYILCPRVTQQHTLLRLWRNQRCVLPHCLLFHDHLSKLKCIRKLSHDCWFNQNIECFRLNSDHWFNEKLLSKRNLIMIIDFIKNTECPKLAMVVDFKVTHLFDPAIDLLITFNASISFG